MTFEAKPEPSRQTFSLEVILSVLHSRCYVPFHEVREIYTFIAGQEVAITEQRQARLHAVFEITAQHRLLTEIPRTINQNDEYVERWLAELKQQYGTEFELIQPPDHFNAPEQRSQQGVAVKVNTKYL